MGDQAKQGSEGKNKSGQVTCAACRHFSRFKNSRGHDSPQALGTCGSVPWDGSKGQWPMFEHPCKEFELAEGSS